MKGMLDPVFEEKVIGHAEVRQLFKLPVSVLSQEAMCLTVPSREDARYASPETRSRSTKVSWLPLRDLKMMSKKFVQAMSVVLYSRISMTLKKKIS